MKSKGEEAIEQDRLHLVSATAAAQAETETDHPQAGDAPRPERPTAALLGFKTIEPEADGDFEWSPTNEDVALPEQRAVAVYGNKWGQVVIRQEKSWDMEEDSFVFIDPKNIDTVVERLMVHKATAERDRPIR